MIRHIVMWKLTDEAKNSNLQGFVADLQSKFKALIGLVDGLMEIEALEGYQVHPAHLAIKDCIKKNTSARIAADYEA